MLASNVLNAQIITTIAGGGTISPSDGLLATNAQLLNSSKIAIDNCGNVYISESAVHKVIKVDAFTGLISTIAGTGVAGYNGDSILATTAMLNSPTYLTLDSVGNLYIGVYARIRKVDRQTGIITTIVGNGINDCTGDGGPATAASTVGGGIAWDRYGNMYLGDKKRIRKVNNSGIISTVAGTGISGATIDGIPATNANMDYPLGVAVDKIGNFYFIDNVGSVRKVDINTGLIRRIAGTGLAIGSYSGDGLSATSCSMNPFDIKIDDTGSIYLACNTNHRIIKVDTFGFTHTIAGTGVIGFSGDGSHPISSQLRFPRDVDIDYRNNIYLSDFGNNRIRKINYSTTPIPSYVTVSAYPNDTICIGAPVTFKANISNGYPTYKWYKNGSLVPGETNSTYEYIPLDGDSIKCVVENMCNVSLLESNTIKIVHGSVSTGIHILGSTTASLGSIVTLYATVTGLTSGYSIKWYNRGSLFSTTSLPEVSYMKIWDVDSIYATLLPPTDMSCYDSTTSAPHYVSDSSTGVRGVGVMGGVYVYPNPANKQVTIMAGERMRSVAISNMQGQELMRYVPHATSYTVAIDMLPPGLYMVRVNDVWVGKVVKE